MSRPATASALAPGVRPLEVWAWAMFDFANSGYTTVVITAVFNAYFVAVVAGNAPWATLAWTGALSVSYLLVMATAPALGAYADAWAAKKRLLAYSTAGCVLFTALLWFAGPGALALAAVLVVLSNFCFGTGENLIAAFLPELARPEALGRVSGWGWGLGFLGGLLSLGCVLAWIAFAEARGDGAGDYVPVAMLITAALFAVSALPTFLILRERAAPQPHLAGASGLREALARLRQTLGQARRFTDLWRFLACIVLYQAGIQAVITLAAIYAQQAMGFGTRQTIELLIVTNLTACAGALAFGAVQDRIGHRRAIALTLAGWILMVLLAWAAQGEAAFWIAANVAGVCLGASQSAGRALVGYLSPASRRAEFFGLWGLAVKLSSILGPLTYGAVAWLTGGDHRAAILVTGSYFLAGLAVLFTVDPERGRQAAYAGVEAYAIQGDGPASSGRL